MQQTLGCEQALHWRRASRVRGRMLRALLPLPRSATHRVARSRRASLRTHRRRRLRAPLRRARDRQTSSQQLATVTGPGTRIARLATQGASNIMRGQILAVIGVSLAVAAVTANAEPAKPS